MASVIYNKAKQLMSNGTIDLDSDNIYVALLMTSSTAGTDNDGVEHVDDIGTLDEMDGANYERKALANKAVNLDDTNDRAEFDADDVTWTALGVGTRSVQGALIYVDADADGASADDSTNDAIAYVQFSSNLDADGSDVTVSWNAEGILQLT